MYLDQTIRWKLITDALPPPPATVFEFGCGHGELLRHLRGLGYAAQGCDPGPEAIRGWGDDLRGITFAGTSEQLGLPANSFDCVVSSDVLEHVPPAAREGFVRDMVRVLRPGGVLAMTVWTRSTLSFRLMGWIYRRHWGKVPAWYAEHLEFPAPGRESIEGWLREGCAMRKVRPYQALLGHLLPAWQHTLRFPRGRLSRSLTRLAPVVHQLDRVGTRGSCFFQASKRPAPAEDSRVSGTPAGSRSSPQPHSSR